MDDHHDDDSGNDGIRNDDTRDDYEVGYGNPPKDSQFKKGKSGNPRGRPKGSKGLKPIVNQVANEPVTVNHAHGARNIPLQEAVVRQLGMKAAKGDLRSIREFLALLRMLEDPEILTVEMPELIARDKKIKNSFMNRMERMKRLTSPETSTPTEGNSKEEPQNHD